LREAEDVVAVDKNTTQANRQSGEIINSVEVVIGEQVKVRTEVDLGDAIVAD
jgi:hypothetical protein